MGMNIWNNIRAPIQHIIIWSHCKPDILCTLRLYLCQSENVYNSATEWYVAQI